MSLLDKFLEQALSRRSVFKDKKFVSMDYVPEELPYREKEILKLADILVSILKGTRPSNVFEYGPVGTGKTAVTQLVLGKLKEKTDKASVSFGYSYVNCRFYRTNYRALVKIAMDLGLKISKTGLPPDVILSLIAKKLEDNCMFFLVVFDEVDWLVKYSGDDILYQFTRLNSELTKSKISLIGITNDVRFREYLDARVLSSLSEETIIFQPYTQEQLYGILLQRAKLAFWEETVDDEAIRYAAAIAARDGDARKAIDLLRVAGEIAERRGDSKVTVDHVAQASEEVERNILKEIISTLPPNQQLLLLGIAGLSKACNKIITGRIKQTYDWLLSQIGKQPITLRRINDYLAELETLGILSSTIISFGRHGRTRVIRLEVPVETVEEILLKDPLFAEIYQELIRMLLKP